MFSYFQLAKFLMSLARNAQKHEVLYGSSSLQYSNADFNQAQWRFSYQAHSRATEKARSFVKLHKSINKTVKSQIPLTYNHTKKNNRYSQIFHNCTIQPSPLRKTEKRRRKNWFPIVWTACEKSQRVTFQTTWLVRSKLRVQMITVWAFNHSHTNFQTTGLGITAFYWGTQH